MTKMNDIYPLIMESFEKGESFIFPVKGTSMNPLLHTNDTVKIISVKNQKIKKGDILLFKRENGQFVLHRVRRIHKDSFDFVGDHQTTLERNVLYDQLIGLVVSYKKQGKDKEYQLKGFKYRIYKILVRIKPIRWIFAHR